MRDRVGPAFRFFRILARNPPEARAEGLPAVAGFLRPIEASSPPSLRDSRLKASGKFYSLTLKWSCWSLFDRLY